MIVAISFHCIAHLKVYRTIKRIRVRIYLTELPEFGIHFVKEMSEVDRSKFKIRKQLDNLITNHEVFMR